MATYSKLALSGSSGGKPIAIAQTATPGTLIHTASGVALDEIWLYAINTSATATKLTIQFGGVTVAENIELTITGETGLVLVIPGLIITSGNIVRAFAGSANVINIAGYVNRIA